MIISNKYKFIFIKTRKTASTSVELALSRFCGERDVLTRLPDADEELRVNMGYKAATGYLKPWLQLSPKEWARTLLVHRPRPLLFQEHASAKDIRSNVGDEVWNSYFKFSIERNPWDKAISAYYYRQAQRKDGMSFQAYLERDDPAYSYTNFELYAVDGSVAVDYMIRYEQLDEDLAEVGRRIGLPEPLVTPPVRAKGTFRTDRRPYAEVIGTRERHLIANRCRREIEEFGYEFEVV